MSIIFNIRRCAPLLGTEVAFPSVYKQCYIAQLKYKTRVSSNLIEKKGFKPNCRWLATTQLKYLHNDYEFPDFSRYRRDSTKCLYTKNKDTVDGRRIFTYMVLGLGAVAGVYSTKATMLHYVLSMSAAEDVLAMASIEVHLKDIPEGSHLTLKWRGKPLFIKHRTQEEIDRERRTDLAILRDPQSDEDRVQRAEWLVVIGVCTHLGCIPIANAGDFNGYYCPCHGSHFDGSGRARKGPAPTNLVVPPYRFIDDDTLLVG